MTYAVETFTTEEQEILRHYVTNLEGPVFALVNLPEVVKGALFRSIFAFLQELATPFS